ncbi:hypothetical protein O181_010322 [Austropuccinia psidii MF-1]|uniref:Uncharacterized protein n=1 Tax=Austropuccinia psidii MF-1 TaxID=1389203 RepID=A0A9Q3GL38_9BASI|nr:hypothetical protein [Austropuccinia psidii MF-1]
MNSYLHITIFLGHGKTIEPLGGWCPLSFKDKVKKIKNLLKNQIILSIDQKKDLEMTPALEEGGPVVSTSSRTVQRQALRTSEETEVPRAIKEREKAEPIVNYLTHKCTGFPNCNFQP